VRISWLTLARKARRAASAARSCSSEFSADATKIRANAAMMRTQSVKLSKCDGVGSGSTTDNVHPWSMSTMTPPPTTMVATSHHTAARRPTRNVATSGTTSIIDRLV
jgi:hypothetical protein